VVYLNFLYGIDRISHSFRKNAPYPSQFDVSSSDETVTEGNRQPLKPVRSTGTGGSAYFYNPAAGSYSTGLADPAAINQFFNPALIPNIFTSSSIFSGETLQGRSSQDYHTVTTAAAVDGYANPTNGYNGGKYLSVGQSSAAAASAADYSRYYSSNVASGAAEAVGEDRSSLSGAVTSGMLAPPTTSQGTGTFSLSFQCCQLFIN
jgi:hypothetical protein